VLKFLSKTPKKEQKKLKNAQFGKTRSIKTRFYLILLRKSTRFDGNALKADFDLPQNQPHVQKSTENNWFLSIYLNANFHVGELSLTHDFY
jgi:plasmid maintenance system killer protein